MSVKKRYIFFKVLICSHPFRRRLIGMNFKRNAYRREYSSSCLSQPWQFSSYTHHWSMFRRRSSLQNQLWHSIRNCTKATHRVSHVHVLKFLSTMGSSFTLTIHCIKSATVYLSPTHGFRIGCHLQTQMHSNCWICFVSRSEVQSPNSFIQFNSTQYITAALTPVHVFQTQVQSFFDQFESTTTKNFLLSLNLIRNTTQANHLVSGLATNVRFGLSDGVTVSSDARWYGNCDCSLSSTCIAQSQFYLTDRNLNMTVPGFYTGCFVVESLLQSTLQCFYNQTCLNALLSPSLNTTALNLTLLRQYSETSTINELLGNLMIEEWSVTSKYDAYYNECQPKECRYVVTARNSAIYVITTLIGIVGGLTTVLTVVVPRMVKFLRRKKRSTPEDVGKPSWIHLLRQLFFVRKVFWHAADKQRNDPHSHFIYSSIHRASMARIHSPSFPESETLLYNVQSVPIHSAVDWSTWTSNATLIDASIYRLVYHSRDSSHPIHITDRCSEDDRHYRTNSGTVFGTVRKPLIESHMSMYSNFYRLWEVHSHWLYTASSLQQYIRHWLLDYVCQRYWSVFQYWFSSDWQIRLWGIAWILRIDWKYHYK